MDKFDIVKLKCNQAITELKALKQEIKKNYPDADTCQLFGKRSQRSWLSQARELKAKGRLN